MADDRHKLTASPGAKDVHGRLEKDGRLGWGIVLDFGKRLKRSAKPGAPDGKYPEKRAMAPPPSKQDLFRIMEANDRIGFAYGIPIEDGETLESYRARLHKFREEHPEQLITGDLVDALAAGIAGVWDGSDRARAAAARLREQARPKPPIPRDTNSVGGPTKLREAKEAGWQVTDLPGGQRRYQARSVVDDLSKHFTEEEIAAARLLVLDAEMATRVNLISARTYEGMPGGGGGGGKAGHLPEGQRQAHNRFMFVMNELEEGMRAAVTSIVIGVRNERLGKPQTAAEFGGVASAYSDKQSRIAFTAGFTKACLRCVYEAQRKWKRMSWQERRDAEARRQVRAKKAAEQQLRNAQGVQDPVKRQAVRQLALE